jgi:hypothetical protein
VDVFGAALVVAGNEAALGCLRNLAWKLRAFSISMRPWAQIQTFPLSTLGAVAMVCVGLMSVLAEKFDEVLARDDFPTTEMSAGVTGVR